MNTEETNLAQNAQQELEEREQVQSHAQFAREMWQKLSQIDVNNHLEKKGKFSYLSWNWAWNTLMDHYPASEYHFGEDGVSEDGSVMVHCQLTIADEFNHVVREMWLPVLDFANKPVKKPNSMDINSARMRCLVKAMSMAGLGNYIYSGLNAPEDKGYGEKEALLLEFNDLIAAKDGAELYAFVHRIGNEAAGELFGTIKADAGVKNKTAKHDAINAWYYPARQMIFDTINQLNEMALEGNTDGMREVLDELHEDSSEAVKKCVWNSLDAATQLKIKDMKSEDK